MTISPALAAVGHVTVAPTPRWAQFAKFASIIPRCRGDVRRRAWNSDPQATTSSRTPISPRNSALLEFLRRLREDQLSVLVPELFGRNLVSFNHRAGRLRANRAPIRLSLLLWLNHTSTSPLLRAFIWSPKKTSGEIAVFAFVGRQQARRLQGH